MNVAAAPTFGQRLLESARAHGEMELQQLRLEQRVLRHQTATSLLPLEAQMQRQLQHTQYQQTKRVTLPEAASSSADSADVAGMSGRPLALQQQLLQHRLLQKRQILQRQAAAPAVCSEASLRRHMVRQASYKMAQQQQMVPPLPSEADDDSWLALPGLAAACSLADPDNSIGKPPAPYSHWQQVSFYIKIIMSM